MKTDQHRFIPNTASDRSDLLDACGVTSFTDLLAGIPQQALFQGQLNNGMGLSEIEIRRRIREMMRESRYSRGAMSYLGAGVYDHFCPAVVNQLTLRGEFLTSYTPYQPEMSQGTLQALFEFQTMVAELFGMEVSNASHYDGSTALAEAALMALRLQKGRKSLLISAGVHPEYIEVIRTYVENLGVDIKIVPLNSAGTTSETELSAQLCEDVTAVVVQSPNFMGCIENQETLAGLSKKIGALFVSSVTEPLSLGLVNPPGYYGADIATGEGQSFGLPLAYGGPYVGLFTSKFENVRQMPGRLCGETVDSKNRRSYTLTLSTREQHIRREKATSNICTNQNLMALWATIWLAMVGKQGFKELAQQNLGKAEYLKDKLQRDGKVKLRYPQTPTFNEFIIDLPMKAEDFFKKAVAKNVAPGLPLSRFYPNDQNGLLVCTTETKTRSDLDLLCSLVKELT